MAWSHAADGANRAACPDDSVHEPVHGETLISPYLTTVRNVTGALDLRPRERIARHRLKAWHGLFCCWM
jgi:hypothetical protein